jgi:hypothetical protein
MAKKLELKWLDAGVFITMETRIGTVADISGIVALQAQNLLANLAVEQRGDGFVT